MSNFDPLAHGAVPVKPFNPLEHGAVPVEQEVSTGRRVASAAKTVGAAAAGALPDTAALAYNLPALGINKLREVAGRSPERNLPLIPSATGAIEDGVDKLTGGYTETPSDQKSFNTGLGFASSLASPAGVAKIGSKALGTFGSKAVNALGSTKPSHLAGAGAAGATLSEMEDAGFSGGESIAGSLAAGAVTGNIHKTPTTFGKLATGFSGVGKGKLNLEAAKSAQDLDINLPKAVVSDSKVIAYADRFLRLSPTGGMIMHKRYAKVGQQAISELDKAYESVISNKELLGIEDKIGKMYTKASESLPSNAATVPKNTFNAITDLREEIKAPALAGDFATINTKLNQIEKEFAPQGIKGIPANTKTLVNQKENLNISIYSDLKTAKGKFLLGKLNDAVKQDLAEYGKTNPEWYNYFTSADKLFSKKAKREELEKMFSGKAESHVHGEVTYGSLSKVLNNPDSKDKLKDLVKPDIFERLEKLGTVAQSMARKNKNVINPSGTAFASMGLGWLTSAVINPVATGSAIIGSSAMAHMLTDKKLLDLAIKYAESSNTKDAIGFNRRMRAMTGYTPLTLMREVEKQQSNEQ